VAEARRNLVPAEVAIVLAIAIVPFPETVPVALPLLVAGTLSRWLRGRSWAEVTKPGYGWIGVAVGVAALGLALIAGTPLVETLSERAVQWSTFPIVRGSVLQAVMVVLVVGVTALATELALRGWLVERVLELSPGSPVLPVMVGAIAEALVTPGDVAARIGAGLFGAGLGWMYVAGGRSVVAPIAARVTFSIGAILLESLRLIG
jgi:hypothetical protein